MEAHSVFSDLHIPDFSRYTRKPHNNRCKPVKPSGFIVEYVDSEISTPIDIATSFK